MKFFVKEKIGLKRSITPEGYLLCEDVPINRTGIMLYGSGETPVEVGPDGIAKIERTEQEVFRPETIASFQGKPVVDEHPDSDVTVDNWNDLAVGIVLNPHRGVGAQDDTVLADLMITNKDAIEAVQGGKNEVSCGYDADYEQIAPGRGLQKNILGNHVAIVDSGRCGSRCSIGDASPAVIPQKGKGTFMKIFEKLREALSKGDAKAATAVLDEIEGDQTNNRSNPPVIVNVRTHDDDDDDRKTHDEEEEKEEKEKERKKTEDSIKDAVFTDARFTDMQKDVKAIRDAVLDADKEDEEEEEEEEEEEGRSRDEGNRKIEGDLEEEAPPGTSDRAAKWKDSANLSDSFQETIALAEVLAPGIQVPSFDSKAKPKKTYDAMCSFRRKVLDYAYVNHMETHNFMDSLLAGRELKKLPCGRVRDVFRATGAWRKNFNNTHSNDSNAGSSAGFSATSATIKSPADLNKRWAEIYKDA